MRVLDIVYSSTARCNHQICFELSEHTYTHFLHKIYGTPWLCFKIHVTNKTPVFLVDRSWNRDSCRWLEQLVCKMTCVFLISAGSCSSMRTFFSTSPHFCVNVYCYYFFNTAIYTQQPFIPSTRCFSLSYERSFTLSDLFSAARLEKPYILLLCHCDVHPKTRDVTHVSPTVTLDLFKSWCTFRNQGGYGFHFSWRMRILFTSLSVIILLINYKTSIFSFSCELKPASIIS